MFIVRHTATAILLTLSSLAGMASSVLANFKQVVKQGGDVRIHPMVARQVDPELLKKMGATVDGPSQAGPAH